MTGATAPPAQREGKAIKASRQDLLSKVSAGTTAHKIVRPANLFGSGRTNLAFPFRVAARVYPHIRVVSVARVNWARQGGGRRLWWASKVEADNAVWPHLRRNPGPQTRRFCAFGWKPKGRGHFSPFLCRSSLADTRYASLLASRNEKKWLPLLTARICGYTPGPSMRRPAAR